MDSLLDRFLRYVQVSTQSDETSRTSPSTARQLDMSRMLAEECRACGFADVTLDEFGIVTATVPATVGHDAPAIAWVAHVDTSPEYSGFGVKPVVHRDYDGRDLTLPGDPSKILRAAENPELKTMIGGTIITSDGTTLLGADDKAGVAVIMTAAANLVSHPDIPHGPIRVCFTCDEEIGHGVDHLELSRLNATCAYTLDSDGHGKVDCETFSADQAIVTVTGVNTHPSIGKGVMVNAIRIVGEFLTALPFDGMSPETTDGREGFLHPYSVEGSTAQAAVRLILRDFETEKLAEYAAMLRQIAQRLEAAHPKASVDVKIVQQYRNMREGLLHEPRAVAKAVEAIEKAGGQPRRTIVRGGTDGSLLTAKGLPTPNLSTGQHNPHSPLEWASLEEMQQAVDVLTQLAIVWGEEKI